MNENTGGSVQISKAEVLNLLFDLFPWARKFEKAPVRDYAAAVFDALPQIQSCDTRIHAMSLVKAWVGETARRRGFDAALAARFENDIASVPVIQTGPHLHLLIEPDAFYTHLFSLMGLGAQQRQTYLCYACSTVKFVERGRKGPGWLELQGQSINVFGLSRSKMIPYSVLAKNGPYQFRLQSADCPGDEPETVARLKQILPLRDFPSAAEAIKSANRCLWRRYFHECISLLQLDDDDVSDLVAKHLSDGKSWLCRRLIGDAQFATEILACVDQLAQSPWQGWLKNSTHYFWGRENGRLFPLRLHGRTLCGKGKEDVQIPFSADCLVNALREGRVVPNLLLMFIVTSILPGVRVLGGSRHTIYYPLMRYAFCTALEKSGRDMVLLATLAQDAMPGAWGHRVISSAAEPFALLEGAGEENIAALIDRFGSMPLDQACGTLSGFTTDGLWADLARAVASGDVAITDSEWAYT